MFNPEVDPKRRIAIIKKSKVKGIDVEYQFGLVYIEEPIVEFAGFCGNLISAVAPFAMNEGLIEGTSPITRVHILDTNTHLHVIADVPAFDKKVQTKGSFSLAEVPGLGAPIELHFQNPAGSATGALLPTGYPIEKIKTSFGTFEISCVDCLAPAVFIHAKDLKLRGDESPLELKRQGEMLEKLEELRHIGAEKMGIPCTGYLPKVVFVSPLNPSKKGHIVARMLALKKMHKAYAVSCAASTAAAALIPGSIVHQMSKLGEVQHEELREITLHHPLGKMAITVKKDRDTITTITMTRTARCLMRGEVLVPYPL